MLRGTWPPGSWDVLAPAVDVPAAAAAVEDVLALAVDVQAAAAAATKVAAAAS